MTRSPCAGARITANQPCILSRYPLALSSRAIHPLSSAECGPQTCVRACLGMVVLRTLAHRVRQQSICKGYKSDVIRVETEG